MAPPQDEVAATNPPSSNDVEMESAKRSLKEMDIDMVERAVEGNNSSSDTGKSPPNDAAGAVPGGEPVDQRAERVTPKAWLCVFFLSLSFGVPFWATPTTAAVAGPLLTRLGSTQLAAWVVPIITTAATVTILLFGANSDLFGRRPFLLFSNFINAAGYAVMATAKTPEHLLAGLALNGAGSGTAGIALIACPELLPNRFRHIGVVLADGFVYIMIIIGPVAGRAAITRGEDDWMYLYWAGFIISVIAFAGLFFFYYPPSHPRGVPWGDALKGLDWIGAALFTPGAVMVLVAIVYTTYLPANDIRVIICFAIGFALVIAFGVWEQFGKVKYPLCPTSIFKSHRGREFTAPFCLSFIVVGFFYGLAVIYPTMLDAFYIDADTPVSEQMALTLPANIGLVAGAILLTVFGSMVKRWRWTLVISVTSLVLWGSLMAMVTPFNKAPMIAFVFLGQLSYGWAAYLAVTFTQLGVPQIYLGISGGLAGLARYAGGAVASACYASAIGNGIRTRGAQLIPEAAAEAGFTGSVDALLAALPSGPGALASVDGVSEEFARALTTAYKWSAAAGLRNAALASLAFGVVGIALALYCEDITPKMNDKIEIFLENDTLAEKNRFH